MGGKQRIATKPIKGMRDFFPEELRLRKWLFDSWRSVAAAYGFQEYDNPPLEPEALYIRKAGDEITGQLYNFADKSNRRISLRPEMTPSLARMVMAQAKSLRFPLRWFSIPQCFRYERMQKGRTREHFQWNMDIVGLDTVVAEAELMSAQADFFRRVGLPCDVDSPGIVFRVSNRKILESFLLDAGLSFEKFAAVCVIVDKKDKIGEQETRKLLTEVGVQESLADKILTLLGIRSLASLTELLGTENPGVTELQELVEHAKHMGFAHLIQIDISVVRGLSYYTGIVWEVFDTGGVVPRSIAGGGRYDKLLNSLGGPDLSMVGFGMGDVVLLLVLAERGLLPELKTGITDVVYPMDAAQFGIAQRIASYLRRQGRNVSVDYTKRRFKHVIRGAEEAQADRLWILGSSEIEAGQVKVRQLDGSRKEELVPLETFTK